jgi:hypothetical protein
VRASAPPGAVLISHKESAMPYHNDPEPVFEKTVGGNLKVRVFMDDDPLDPRKEGDCYLGTMACFHSRYDLGDSRDEYQFSDVGAMRDWLKVHEDELVILPLFLYDHSGITMNTRGFSCPWDSGKVGWIYVSREDILENWGRKRLTAKLRRQAEKVLIAEVEAYDQYLVGDVYGYTISREETCNDCGHTEDVHLDSCWGYYGLDYVKEAALEAADWEVKNA